MADELQLNNISQGNENDTTQLMPESNQIQLFLDQAKNCLSISCNLQLIFEKTITNICYLYSNIKFIAGYIYSDFQKKSLPFKIGVATIFLIICFMNILQDIIDFSPLVYLRINEQLVGEPDQIIIPDLNLLTPKENPNTFDYLFINHTDINLDFCNQFNNTLMGCTPRWIVPGVLYNYDQIEEYNRNKSDNSSNSTTSSRVLDILNQTSQNSSDNSSQQQNKVNFSNTQSYVIMLDSQKEISLGIGKHIQTLRPLKMNEAYITSGAYRNLGNPKKILVQLNFIQFIMDLKQIDFSNYDTVEEGQRAEVKIILIEIFKKNHILLKMIADPKDTQDQYQQPDYIYSRLNNKVNFIHVIEILKNYQIPVNITNDQNELLKHLKINLDELIDDIADIIFTQKFAFFLYPTQIIEDPAGKWPETFGNTIAFDHSSFMDIIKKALEQNTSSEYDFVRENIMQVLLRFELSQTLGLKTNLTFSIINYAFQTLIVYKNRATIYRNSGLVYAYDLWTSNNFYLSLGKKYPAKILSPLCYQTLKTLYTSSFLGNFFDTAIWLLLIISSFLIYLVSMSDCEEKISEYSNLRVLGMNKLQVFLILFMKSIFYSIASLILSLIVSYIIRILGAMLVFRIIQDVDDSSKINSTIINTSLLLGVIMPLISNIIPIRKALQTSLRESLSKDRASSQHYMNQIKIYVMKMEKYGIELGTVIISILMIFMGYLCYYVIPKIYMDGDIIQFLFLVNSCFLLMIFGLTILLSTIQPYLQILLLKILLYCFLPLDNNLYNLIANNQRSHKRKTEKIAFIFSLIFTFLIFAVSGFTMQIHIIQNSIKANVGADWTAELEANNRADDYSLDTFALQQFFDQYKMNYPNQIYDYACHSSDINVYPGINDDLKNPKLRGPAKKPYIRVAIRTVPNNYFNVVYNDFYVPGTILDKSHDYHLLPGSSVINPMNIIYDENGCSRGFLCNKSEDEQNQTLYNQVQNLDTNNIVSQLYNKSFIDNRVDHEIYAIMYEGFKNTLGIIDSNYQLILEVNKTLFRIKPAHTANRFPGIIKPLDSEISNRNYVIISQDSYKFIINTVWNSPDADKKQIRNFQKALPNGLIDGITCLKIFVKFQRPLSKIEREDFADQLKSSIRLKTPLVIFDMQDMMEKTNAAIDYLHWFIGFISFLTITIGFLMLIVMFRNIVKEHVYEIKVIRAIGINTNQLTKIYIYEAIILILSASILGTIVGYIISMTLCFEISMFLQINQNCYEFPYFFVSILFVAGMTSATLSSFVAIKNIRNYIIEDITKKDI